MLVGREAHVHPPTLDAYSHLPLFNTKAVVHTTGVPAPTLRAWERRYGILAPRRGDNDYRLYSERDMVLIAWLRERVESGMTISQAIALLRSIEPGRRRKSRGREAPALDTPATAPTPSAVIVPERLALPELVGALLRHFVTLDEPGAMRTMAQALAVYPVEDVCLALFVPVLESIGQRWAAGELTVTVEHFASAVIRAQLEALFRATPGGDGGRLVLVGCAPGNLHELGPLMLALFLRRAGIHVAFIGQNVSAEHLLATVESVNPACVALSAANAADVAALREIGTRLRSTNERGRLFCVGGRAFSEPSALVQDVPGTLIYGHARMAVDEIKKRLAG